MKTRQIPSRSKSHGLTRLEVVAILATVGLILSVLLLPNPGGDKGKAPRVVCASKLKQLALEFSIWSQDHHTSRFGFQVSTNEGGSLEYGCGTNTFRHFQFISNELISPVLLACPSDKERVKAVRKLLRQHTNFTRAWAGLDNRQVSYFVNLDAQPGNPQSVLLGDRNVTNHGFNPRTCLLASSNNTPHWSRGQHGPLGKDPSDGNIAFADGSVTMATDFFLGEQFRRLSGVTNRLAVP